MVKRLLPHLLIAALLLAACSLISRATKHPTTETISVARDHVCALAFALPVSELEPLRHACAAGATAAELAERFHDCAGQLAAQPR